MLGRGGQQVPAQSGLVLIDHETIPPPRQVQDPSSFPPPPPKLREMLSRGGPVGHWQQQIALRTPVPGLSRLPSQRNQTAVLAANHKTFLIYSHGKTLQTEATKYWATIALNLSLPAKAGQLNSPGAGEGRDSWPPVRTWAVLAWVTACLGNNHQIWGLRNSSLCYLQFRHLKKQTDSQEHRGHLTATSSTSEG